MQRDFFSQEPTSRFMQRLFIYGLVSSAGLLSATLKGEASLFSNAATLAAVGAASGNPAFTMAAMQNATLASRTQDPNAASTNGVQAPPAPTVQSAPTMPSTPTTPSQVDLSGIQQQGTDQITNMDPNSDQDTANTVNSIDQLTAANAALTQQILASGIAGLAPQTAPATYVKQGLSMGQVLQKYFNPGSASSSGQSGTTTSGMTPPTPGGTTASTGGAHSGGNSDLVSGAASPSQQVSNLANGLPDPNVSGTNASGPLASVTGNGDPNASIGTTGTTAGGGSGGSGLMVTTFPPPATGTGN